MSTEELLKLPIAAKEKIIQPRYAGRNGKGVIRLQYFRQLKLRNAAIEQRGEEEVNGSLRLISNLEVSLEDAWEDVEQIRSEEY